MQMRDTLSVFKARSTYVVAAAVSLAVALNIIEPSEHEDTMIVAQAVSEGFFDSAFEILDSYSDITVAALAVWAWVERILGTKQLTLKEE